MFITMTDGRTDNPRTNDLLDAFRKVAREQDDRIVEGYVLQDAKDPGHWRLVAFWKSREAFDQVVAEGQIRGPQILQAGGIEHPEMSLFEQRGVISEVSHSKRGGLVTAGARHR